MKNLFVVMIIGLGLVSSAYSQENQRARMYIGADANVPFSDFASGAYVIADGAETHNQEGTFSPALGFTLGVEIPIANFLAIRPTASVTAYNGTHYVALIDKPKMKLYELRVGADLIYYISGMEQSSLYFLATAADNIEKLSVNRILFTERFNSTRISAGVGAGYTFGLNQSMSVQAVVSNSVSGEPPARPNFPALSVVTISFGLKL